MDFNLRSVTDSLQYFGQVLLMGGPQCPLWEMERPCKLIGVSSHLTKGFFAPLNLWAVEELALLNSALRSVSSTYL